MSKKRSILHYFKNRQRLLLVGVAAVISIGGIVGLSLSHAATPYIAAEAESGTVRSPAINVNDTAASGGKAVSFTAAGGGGSNPISALPLIPWEGGPAYWNKFPTTKAGGWSDPGFFPIAIWYNAISSNAEAQFDKSYGINTYSGMGPTAYRLFADNGMYWIGGKLGNDFTSSSVNWAGDFLDDEVDGRFDAATGLARIKSLSDGYGNDGRFRYANYTQIVTGDYGATNNSNSEKYVDAVDGPVSVDHYFYTIPNCNTSLDYILVPHDSGHCRTASSYGKAMKALWTRDAANGTHKPIWNFIENMNGGPGEGPFYAYITPGQLEGAVMDSVINEARGIIYFNQSFSGNCTAGSILRQLEVNANYCAKPQMEAMKEVNLRIKALAPVINTQSYQYVFGTNLDTMLKWYNDSAYIFAMPSGDATSQPGARTFTLPAGLKSATKVEVLNENRSITPSAGSFSDNFAAEYTYHIYKVTPN